jgi:hypothetical protein
VGFRAAVTCGKCKQPIVSEEGFGFVRFKIPGTEGYQFFHRRSRGEECWEAYMKERTYVVQLKEEVERWA